MHARSIALHITLLAGFAATAPAQTILQMGGDPGYFGNSHGEAINSDGTVVVGYCDIAFGGLVANRWTLSGGMEGRSCGWASVLRCVNSTGTVAGGYAGYGGAPRYIGIRLNTSNVGCAASLPLIGPLIWSYANGMDATGNLVVGHYDVSTSGNSNNFVPVKWPNSSSVVALPLPAGHARGIAAAVSANAQVIVGDTGPQCCVNSYPATAAYWDAAGVHSMGNPATFIASTATATSGDGSVIVGRATTSLGRSRAFRWVSSTYADLGLLPVPTSTSYSDARAVSQDGTVVVGDASDFSGDQAFIWREDLGLIRLDSLLSALGVNLSGWTLKTCHGISADNTALCGTGVYNGYGTGFVVRDLPQLCGPLIVQQPVAQSVCAGQTAFLSVGAYFPSHTRFQWYLKHGSGRNEYYTPIANGPSGHGSTVSGATSASMAFTTVTPEDAGVYHCVITGGCATVVSFDVTLTVGPTPVLTVMPPLDEIPCGHGPQTISLAATSPDPISYQWQAETPFMSGIYTDLTNGLVPGIGTVSGAQTPSLTVSNFFLTGSTVYRCRMTNGCGSSYGSTLVHPCFGDFNCDGAVDFFDYVDMIDAYSTSSPYGDFNQDGSIDFFDYLDFVDAFTGAC